MQTAAVTSLAPKHPPIDPIEPGEDDRPTGSIVMPAPRSVCPPSPPVTFNPLAAALERPRYNPEHARALSHAKALLTKIRDGYRPEEFTTQIHAALNDGLFTQAELDQATCASGEKRARAALRAIRYGGNPNDQRIGRMVSEGLAEGFLTQELLDQAVAYAQTRSIRAWP